MDIRNPFGLRNGKIVMIEDVPKEKRGLECDCICPNCKEPFIARLGDVNRHHFAHSGKGCDEVNAYLTGMYMMLNEHLSNKHPIYLPPVIVSFELSAFSYITEKNIKEKTHLLSKSVDDSCEELVGKDVDQAVFDSSEIIYSSSGRPNVIIVKKGMRSLAIRIIPPDTICKYGTVSRYKDMATLEIDLSGCEELLQKSKKSVIFSYIEKTKTICRWTYNPLVERAHSNIMKRSKAYYDAARDRIRKEEEKRRSILKARKAFPSEILVTVSRTCGASSTLKESVSIWSIDKETKNKKGYEEVKDKFTQQDEQIRDSFGTRWVQCEKCGQIKPDSQFIRYGGENSINLGLCEDCAGMRR